MKTQQNSHLPDKAQLEGPLSGVNVLDLSAYIAGPYGCTLLADQGANVIKVEPPAGDNLRKYPSTLKAESRAFLGINRSKLGVSIDLKTSEGREIICKLIKNVDVVVHNFRPGVPEKLGIDFDKLQNINPRLIYCVVSGYGETGPLKSKAGYDQVLQTMSGMCSMQGERGGAPEILYGSVVDYYAAALVASATSSALYERERSGVGQYIGVSLLRSALTMQSARLVWAEGEPEDIGRDFRSGGITGLHPTRDGYLYLSANTPKFWQSLCEKVGLPDFLINERYDSIRKRAEYADEILPSLQVALQVNTALEWEEILGDDVPCAAARRVEDLFNNEQVNAEEMLTTFKHPEVGTYKGQSRSVKFNRTPGPQPFAAPIFGQHTNEVLIELGFTIEECIELRKKGIVK
jgi:formyl-CoA transferase